MLLETGVAPRTSYAAPEGWSHYQVIEVNIDNEMKSFVEIWAVRQKAKAF